MISAVIIDDDELSRKAIQQCIQRCDSVELIKEYSSAVDAIQDIENLDCDLIFLDIEMPEMDGIEFIARTKNIPQIVVVSSKSDYAVESYNYDVSDYIVKPIDYPRFLKSINKVRTLKEEVISTVIQDHLFLKKKNNLYERVDYKDILYIEAYADYVSIHTINNKYTILSTMKAIEYRLPVDEFMRVHRSFIIRLDKISTIEENSISINGKQIPVSRSQRAGFMDKINLF